MGKRRILTPFCRGNWLGNEKEKEKEKKRKVRVYAFVVVETCVQSSVHVTCENRTNVGHDNRRL